MPIFVVCSLGRSPQRVKVDAAPVRVGRDPTNDIVLHDASVSRDHAMFMEDEAGRWLVSVVSDTNAVVVDGKLVQSGAPVGEGTQILVGSDHMIIFSHNDASASEYFGSMAGFTRAECASCRWKGLISTFRRQALCPRCGGSNFAGTDRYESDDDGAVLDSPTRVASAKDLTEGFSRLLAAKRSSIERTDDRKDAGYRVMLQEGQALELGTASNAQLKLYGFFVFGHAKVTWSGDHYVVHSHMTFPSLKVNGTSVKAAALKNGDLITIGSNSFRFVVS